MIKAVARVYGSIRRTAEQFRAQVMEADELREPIDEIRAAYHGTRAELDSARDIARRELQRARGEVMRAQQKINEIAREEAKRAPALGDRVAATGPGGQAEPPANAPTGAPATVPAAGATAVPAAVPGAVPAAVPTAVPSSSPTAANPAGERDVA